MTETHRFLLVEDDSISCMMSTMMIENAAPGATVKAINDPLEALDFIRQQVPENNSVLLLDINMPKMNGWQFLDEFQKLSEATRATYRVYILSSSLDAQDREKAREYPFLKGFFQKPLKVEDFARMLAHDRAA